MSPLENLPNEVTQHILSFLKIEDLTKVRQASKLLKDNAEVPLVIESGKLNSERALAPVFQIFNEEIENGYKRQCNKQLIGSTYPVSSVKRKPLGRVRNFFTGKDLKKEVKNYLNANSEEIVKSHTPLVKSKLLSSTADAGVTAVSKKFFLESRTKVISDITYRLRMADFTAADVKKCY